MDIIKTGIVVGGILSLALAIFHSRFYQQFNWREEFEKISSLNRRILYTIHIALILLLLVFAFISFTYTEELSQGEGLAAGITVAYSLFWLWRTIWQVIYFRPSKIDHDQKLLFLHYSLIVISTILFIVYLAPVASKLLG